MSEKNFGTLGTSFQQALLKAIIEDKKYGEQIIDVIENKLKNTIRSIPKFRTMIVWHLK